MSWTRGWSPGSELGELRVMGRFAAIDALHTLGRTTFSAGFRREYDELLGVSSSGSTARGSLHYQLGRNTAVAGVVERALTSGLGEPADARAQFAIRQDAVTKAGRLQLNLGARVGRLREREISETSVAFGTTLLVKDIVSVNANAGSTRFSEGPWFWHAAFGAGIELASLGAYFRYTFRPEGRGSTRAVAITYTRHDPGPPHP
jgi:hypothetical protein